MALSLRGRARQAVSSDSSKNLPCNLQKEFVVNYTGQCHRVTVPNSDPKIYRKAEWQLQAPLAWAVKVSPLLWHVVGIQGNFQSYICAASMCGGIHVSRSASKNTFFTRCLLDIELKSSDCNASSSNFCTISLVYTKYCLISYAKLLL